jgi:hypothetical protein
MEWFAILQRVSFTQYVWFSEMKPREKTANPSAKVTGGYNKAIKPHTAWALFWKKLTPAEKAIIKSIPNFTAKKWKTITGIRVK